MALWQLWKTWAAQLISSSPPPPFINWPDNQITSCWNKSIYIYIWAYISSNNRHTRLGLYVYPNICSCSSTAVSICHKTRTWSIAIPKWDLLALDPGKVKLPAQSCSEGSHTPFNRNKARCKNGWDTRYSLHKWFKSDPRLRTLIPWRLQE